MDPWSLPKARPISCNDSPAFQRRHMSTRCSAESLFRFPCAINTTFRKMIPMRWCCIDQLSRHDIAGTTGSESKEIRERPRFRDTISRTVPFPDRQLRTLMTRTEILQRLQTIKEKGTQALRLLESKPLSVDTQTEIRSLAQWIKRRAAQRIQPHVARASAKDDVGVRTQRLFTRDRRKLEEKWHQPVEDRRTPRSKMAGTARGRGL